MEETTLVKSADSSSSYRSRRGTLWPRVGDLHVDAVGGCRGDGATPGRGFGSSRVEPGLTLSQGPMAANDALVARWYRCCRPWPD